MKVLRLLVLVFLFVAACSRTAPILNINNAAYPLGQVSKAQLKEVEKNIILAGTGLGWSMKTQGPGHIVATLNVRSHTAVVDIFFNQKDYSIVYKNSENLKYTGGTIHSNYNGWIQNLDRRIRMYLLSAPGK